MGFGEIVQNNNPEKQIPKVEKKENNFLDYNTEIKKTGENIKSQYPKFDLDNFGIFVQKILEDDSIKKEDLNKYIENIFKEYLNTNPNFNFNTDDNYLLISIKKEIFKNKEDKEAKDQDKETKDQDKETKDQDKETKDQDKETKDQDKETKDQDKETKQLIMERINYQKKLYQSIPDQYKPQNNPTNFLDFQKLYLTSDIKQKLDNASIPIDDYFAHRYTAQKLSQSLEILPNKYEFIQSFNQLNKLLDIDIQIPLVPDKLPNYKPLPDSLDDFQTKPEKILALDSVKDYIDSSPDILNDQDITMPDGDIIKLYSDRIPDIISEILSKNNLDQSLIKYFDIKNYDNKTGILDKKTIKEINDETLLNQLQQIATAISEKFIKQGKEEILQITNKIIKQKVMTTVFRGVSEFFDITNPNIENFSSDFQLDFNQDLKLENNVVKIDGMINGSFIGLYYDLNTGKLKMDDVVSFDAENKIYKISQKTGTLLDLPINLPKPQDFYDDARQFDYRDISKNSDNLDEYKNKLNQKIGPVFYGNFVHKELNQYYIRRYNEKNLAVQSAFNYSLANRSSATSNDRSFDISQSIEFKKDINSGHFEFAKIIDDTFDYYSKSNNLLKIRNLFEKFDMIINSKNVQDGNTNENLINQLFNFQQMSTSANNRKDMGAGDDLNYLQFYKLISKSRGDKQIIDLDILDRVVSILDKSESFSDPANKKKFNGDFWDKYDKIISDPDKELENKLGI